MGVNEHFESIFNAVMCQLKGFKQLLRVIRYTAHKERPAQCHQIQVFATYEFDEL